MNALLNLAHASQRSGFKGDGNKSSVFSHIQPMYLADPYPCEEQVNFAKWYVISYDTDFTHALSYLLR